MEPDPAKLLADGEPPLAVPDNARSDESNAVTDSPKFTVKLIVAALVKEPLAPCVDVIIGVGAVVSEVMVNWVAALLGFAAASDATDDGISTITVPSEDETTSNV